MNPNLKWERQFYKKFKLIDENTAEMAWSFRQHTLELMRMGTSAFIQIEKLNRQSKTC